MGHKEQLVWSLDLLHLICKIMLNLFDNQSNPVEQNLQHDLPWSVSK